MKNLIALLDNIQLGKSNNLLVLHHDGFSVTAALVHAGISGQVIQASASSRAIDIMVAMAEVVEKIRAAGVRKLPKQAVLVTASAMAALIHLPVHPDKPRPALQMKELVRWELEPLFAQQNTRWCIGSLLMGRGYISQKNRAAVMQKIHADNALSSQRTTVRFGDAARQMDFITRDQIDECLSLQEKLMQFEDETLCGWAAQKISDDEEIDEAAPRYPWFATGVSDGQRKQWVNACWHQKITLKSIYPLLGTAYNTIPWHKDRDELLIDVQQEQFVVMRGRPGALKSYRVENACDGEVSNSQIIDLCHEEMRPDINRIFVNAPASVFDAVVAELSAKMEREVYGLDNKQLKRAAA